MNGKLKPVNWKLKPVNRKQNLVNQKVKTRSRKPKESKIKPGLMIEKKPVDQKPSAVWWKRLTTSQPVSLH